VNLHNNSAHVSESVSNCVPLVGIGSVVVNNGGEPNWRIQSSIKKNVRVRGAVGHNNNSKQSTNDTDFTTDNKNSDITVNIIVENANDVKDEDNNSNSYTVTNTLKRNREDEKIDIPNEIEGNSYPLSINNSVTLQTDIEYLSKKPKIEKKYYK